MIVEAKTLDDGSIEATYIEDGIVKAVRYYEKDEEVPTEPPEEEINDIAAMDLFMNDGGFIYG